MLVWDTLVSDVGFSPFGTYLMAREPTDFEHAPGIWFADLAAITDPKWVQLGNGPMFTSIQPQWSPDGQWVAYSEYAHSSSQDGAWDGWHIPSASGHRLFEASLDYGKDRAWADDSRIVAEAVGGKSRNYLRARFVDGTSLSAIMEVDVDGAPGGLQWQPVSASNSGP